MRLSTPLHHAGSSHFSGVALDPSASLFLETQLEVTSASGHLGIINSPSAVLRSELRTSILAGLQLFPQFRHCLYVHRDGLYPENSSAVVQPGLCCCGRTLCLPHLYWAGQPVLPATGDGDRRSSPKTASTTIFSHPCHRDGIVDSHLLSLPSPFDFSLLPRQFRPSQGHRFN